MNPLDKFLNIERIDEYTYSGCETCGSDNIDTCLCIRDPDLFFRKIELYKIKRNRTVEICEDTKYIHLPESIKRNMEKLVILGMVQNTCINFRNCEKLKYVVLPLEIKRLKTKSFYNCISLHTINLLEKLSVIEENCFENCESLLEIEIPDSVNYIGANTFKYCKKLRKVHLSPNCEHIFAGTFSYCISLRKITVPEGVKSIRNRVFMNCCNLENIYLPVSLVDIGQNVFTGCSKNLIIHAVNISFNDSKGRKIVFRELKFNNNILKYTLENIFEITKEKDFMYFDDSKPTNLNNKILISQNPLYFYTLGGDGFTLVEWINNPHKNIIVSLLENYPELKPKEEENIKILFEGYTDPIADITPWQIGEIIEESGTKNIITFPILIVWG